jgi:uncharacterized membrane protein
MLEAARLWLNGLSPAEQGLGIIGLTLVPWIELRGSIPLAIALGWHPLAAGLLAIVANWLIIVPGYVFLELFYHRWLSRYALLRRIVERVRARGGAMVERYELLGLALFVAIPIPGTGAYAGTLLAWLLGLNRSKSLGAVALGVALAGVAITLVASGAAAALRRIL